MALDENPDEVFDNEPEAEGNGDEKPNRSFLYLMIGMIAFGVIGVLVVVFALFNRQSANDKVAQDNAMIQATNDAVIALSQNTPTPLPTDTPAPTNTALPTYTPTAIPSPTPAPTQTPTISETLVVTGTSVLTSTTGSTAKTTVTPANKATTVAQAQGQATTVAAATAKSATGSQTTAVPGSSSSASAATATVAASKNVTGTHPISSTTGTGANGLPTTGANDNLFILLLAAVGLVGVLVVARRLRTS